MLQPIAVHKAKGGGVHAVPQPSLISWAIREDVAEVTVSMLRTDLGTGHAMGAVNLFDDVCPIDGPGEARSACAAVKFVEGSKKRFAGDDVDVKTRLFVVPVLIGESPFGSIRLCYAELFRGQPRQGFRTPVVSFHMRILIGVGGREAVRFRPIKDGYAAQATEPNAASPFMRPHAKVGKAAGQGTLSIQFLEYVGRIPFEF